MKKLVSNRKARFDYHIDKTWEAGVALMGSEVKAIRMGRIQLQDAWIDLRSGEAWLMDAHVGEYPQARHYTHEPRRERKLLLNRAELEKIERQVRAKGFSLIPLDVHLSERGLIKITIGLGRGKRSYDKRQTIKKRDQKRDAEREM